MSVFYDHLIGLDEIHNDLSEFDLPFRDHYELLNQIDSILHNEVLDVILVILPRNHHEYFLKSFYDKPYDQNHLIFLRQFDPEVDQKIWEKANTIKTKLKEDIKKVKK